MRSGSVRSAEQRCAVTMESVVTAALVAYKRVRSGTGGKTINEVDPYLYTNNPPAYVGLRTIFYKEIDVPFGCL